jgi:hypothetical protein
MSRSDRAAGESTPYGEARPPEPRLAWAFVAERDAPAGEGTLDGAFARRTLRPAGERLEHAPGGDPHRLVRISAYAGLAPRRRPHAFCPVCLERVTLRLGPRNRHHYAHRPGSVCAAARGEGALHLSAKLHLAAALAAGGERLLLHPLCARVAGERIAERCARGPHEVWEIAWDEVRVESALPSARADLVLLDRGREVAAVEVCAHHAVDEAKARKYRALGLAWIEVPAWSVLPAAGVAWSAAEPLPVLQESRRHPERWRCDRHRALHEAAVEHERSGTHLLAARVVHLYRADGGRSTGEPRVRATRVWMVERREEGRAVEAWLERDGRDGPLGAPARVDGAAAARRTLHARFLAWVRWLREHERVEVDSPMPWVEPRALDGWRRSAAFPERMRWDAHRGAFAPLPNLPRVAWPRLPPAAGAPDPVLGWSGCAWTALEPGRPPLLHAVARHAWVTVRVHRPADPGAGSVAHLSAHLHDGRRWRAIERAPFVAGLEARGDASLGATELALGLARALAERPVDALLDGVLVAEILAGLRYDGGDRAGTGALVAPVRRRR